MKEFALVIIATLGLCLLVEASKYANHLKEEREIERWIENGKEVIILEEMSIDFSEVS